MPSEDRPGNVMRKGTILGFAAVCLVVLVQDREDALAAGQPETVRLTLAEAVERALRRNPKLVEARLDRTLEKFDLEQAEAMFAPEVSFGTAATGYKLDRGADTRSYEFRAGPSVTMKLPTGGEIGVKPAWTATLDRTGEPGQVYDATMELSFSHPLLKGAGLDAGLAPIRLARIAEESNVLKLRADAMDVVTSVIEAYRAAIRAEKQVEIDEGALQRAKETLEVNRLLVDTGRMARADIVQTEADIARRELDVVRSRDRMDDAGRKLNVLLDLDSGIRLVPVDPLTVEPHRPDLEAIRALGRERNPGYLGARLALRAAEIRLEQAEDNSLWDLSFTARAEFGGQGGSFGSGLGDLAGDSRNEGAYSLGLALSVPLGDTAAKAAKRAQLAARLDRRKAERALATAARELDTGLLNAVRAVELGLTQMELARQALALAEEKLRIEQGKLRLGLTSNYRLASFQTDLVNAQVSELDAKVGYLNAVAALDRAAGTVLDTWNIDIRSLSEDRK